MSRTPILDRLAYASERFANLEAEIERLRAELARLRGLPHMDRLSKDRNEIVEECARVATQLIVCLHCGSDVTEKVAAAIRALKEKP